MPSQWALLGAYKTGVLALKTASLNVNCEALRLWAPSVLPGLSIIDSLSDNVVLNPGFVVVRVVALKAFTWSGQQ